MLYADPNPAIPESLWIYVKIYPHPYNDLVPSPSVLTFPIHAAIGLLYNLPHKQEEPFQLQVLVDRWLKFNTIVIWPQEWVEVTVLFWDLSSFPSDIYTKTERNRFSVRLDSPVFKVHHFFFFSSFFTNPSRRWQMTLIMTPTLTWVRIQRIYKRFLACQGSSTRNSIFRFKVRSHLGPFVERRWIHQEHVPW